MVDINSIRVHLGLTFKFHESDFSLLGARAVAMYVEQAEKMIDEFHTNFPEARKYMAKKMTTKKTAAERKQAEAREPSQNIKDRVSTDLNEELAKTPTPIDQPESTEAPTDSFVSPESSNIHSAQFFNIDEKVGRDKAHIIIHFKADHKGADQSKIARSYIYTDPLAPEVGPIDGRLWDQFKSESSKGRYFASQIRNRYKSELIWPLGK